MPSERGRFVPMSLPRKWMTDLLYFASKVRTVAVTRTLRVRALADARKSGERSVGWGALLTKGLGIVSTRVPELRWAYMPYPWPHFYEAPYSVASVVVHRVFDGYVAGKVLGELEKVLNAEILAEVRGTEAKAAA